MSNSEAGPGASFRRVLAVIPARGGSKGVPAKNLAPVGGVPLVARAVRECRATRLVTDVVVSTDDQAIAAAAREAGAEVVLRPSAIAGDTATSEAAVLHAMDTHEALHGAPVDVVLLVQCTSPFLVREDIDGVAAAVAENGADTAVTVAPFHGFVWRESEAETEGGVGVNHDKSYRPRRQDRPQDFLETGTAYAMDAAGFASTGTASSATPSWSAPTRPGCWRSTTRTTWRGPGPSRPSSTRTAPVRCRPPTTWTRSYWTSTAPRPTTGC